MENSVSNHTVYFESKVALDGSTQYDLNVDLNLYSYVRSCILGRSVFILFAVIFLLIFWRQPALVPYAFIFPVSYIISDTRYGAMLRKRTAEHYDGRVIANGGISPLNSEIVFSDKIYLKKDNFIKPAAYPYDFVWSLCEHKQHYLLVLRDNTFLTINKENVSGREVTFPQFIFYKCPNTRRWGAIDIRRGRRIRAVFLVAEYAIVAALALGWAAAYFFLG